VGMPGVGVHETLNFSAFKKELFDACFREKMPIFSYYVSLNNFLQIKTWRLIENIKTTLLTHP
jgi:hypothetical protein